jgi:cellulose synthase/poly-beta-1,6-N-acetylglucosamine synthase-like glycosyltransferase
VDGKKNLMPRVSLIIPCYNEETTIEELLLSIEAQTFPQTDMETIIADGLSIDKTRGIIAAFQASHPRMNVRVVDNPKRVIPAGLNAAIRASQGQLIVRMDAHTIPAKNYIELSVKAFDEGKGADVGGVIDIAPGRQNWIGKAIAVATRHPLGVGDARYRWTTKATYADTVAFGTYAKKTFDEIGLYDESLVANEDYEMNARLRTAGEKIWIDPAIRATYHSRPDLASLSRQYFTYGYYKYRMLKRFPKTIRWRQALPPLFILGVLMLLLLALFWNIAQIILLTILGLYFLILTGASVPEALKQKEISLILGIPLAIMTMHFSWGLGFWWSTLKGAAEK